MPIFAPSMLHGALCAVFLQVGALSSPPRRRRWPTNGTRCQRRRVGTYEVISALHGAADVNRDGVIEAQRALRVHHGAANAEVIDPRARSSGAGATAGVECAAPWSICRLCAPGGATLIGLLSRRAGSSWRTHAATGSGRALNWERGSSARGLRPEREPLTSGATTARREIQLEPGAKVASGVDSDEDVLPSG